jgi:hypothetical protein
LFLYSQVGRNKTPRVFWPPNESWSTCPRRQNASLTQSVRQPLSYPEQSPSAIPSEVAAESVSNFIERHKILLELGQKRNEILFDGVKPVGEECAPKCCRSQTSVTGATGPMRS